MAVAPARPAASSCRSSVTLSRLAASFAGASRGALAWRITMTWPPARSAAISSAPVSVCASTLATARVPTANRAKAVNPACIRSPPLGFPDHQFQARPDIGDGAHLDVDEPEWQGDLADRVLGDVCGNA